MNWKFWQNKELGSFLDFLQKLVFAVGIPLSIYTYFQKAERERADREYFIYDNMDRKYWEYEMVAAKYPQLGLSDATLTDTLLQKCVRPDSLLTTEDRVLTRQMMFMIICMYERAYLLYSDGASDFRARQWVGWQGGLDRWVKDARFIDAWHKIGSDFDAEFQAHVNNRAKDLKAPVLK